MSSPEVLVIGITGGSCSGKTTLASKLQARLGTERSALLLQDSYYIDQSHRFREDGGDVNFDHPEALEFSLLARHLNDLRTRKSIQIPRYDFVTHRRLAESLLQAPRDVILVDGILLLHDSNVRSQLGVSIYVDAPESIRFERRKNRDTRERGRELAGVIRQFENHVKPMHDLFVEPSKSHATYVFDGTKNESSLFEDLIHKLGLKS